MICGTILVVDDEKSLRRHLSTLLSRNGYQTATAESAARAREVMPKLFPDCVLMDLHLPDGSGSDLMAELKEQFPETQFIVITAFGSIRSAVDSTKRGAFSYLEKPFDPDDLLLTIRSAMSERALGEEVRRLRSKMTNSKPPHLDSSATPYRSGAMFRTMSIARQASDHDGNVLLLGESGTGKDFLARWIHRSSRRKSGPFFSINCAALTPELAESELFGHEPGAFTGTRGRKRGLLELADQGTILLDEIGEMDILLQSKLLTFLDTKQFVRVGGESLIDIDTRIITATNRNLRAEVDAGRFRRDLYYRLNVVPITVPPLRERGEDLPILVEETILKLCGDMSLPQPPALDPRVLDRLAAYHWPGNVRELRNVLERAIIISRGRTITPGDLNLDSSPNDSHGNNWRLGVEFPSPGQSLHDVTRDVARRIVQEALRRSSTKTEAAEMIGLTRHALAHQLKILEITNDG